MKETSYKCPVCQGILHSEFGEQIHPLDPNYGVMVFCRNNLCSAQEVMGHGKNEKEAFEIVTARFKAHV
jgi:hypothetical protein